MNARQSMAYRPVAGRPTSIMRIIAAVLTVLAVRAFATGSAPAAELRLRSQCRSDGTIVTLGDLAEIFAADRQQADALAAVELFPAPSASRQRFVRVREIQDLLLSRGINLAEHRFSGSSQVTILGAEPVRIERERPLSSSEQRIANRRISDAVVQYLQQHPGISADLPRIVEVDVDESRARLAASPEHRISITGGTPPWTGRQQFEVTLDTPDGPVRFALAAQITAPVARVVALRSLPKGTILGAADVAVQRQTMRQKSAEGFYSVDEVIGKETTQAIAKGAMLQPQMVQAPLLVRRRDVVTVTARNSGIRVRTLARAREDGSLGELILVESPLDRKTYYARVGGIREVEIFGRSIQASGAGAEGPSQMVRR